jgi:hypothetical protein
MSQGIGTPAELRARVDLTKNEIAHLWDGGASRRRLPLAEGGVRSAVLMSAVVRR